MITTCGNSISFPLKLIFKSTINEGAFPEDSLHKKMKFSIQENRKLHFLCRDWKKSNVLAIHKKE